MACFPAVLGGLALAGPTTTKTRSGRGQDAALRQTCPVYAFATPHSVEFHACPFIARSRTPMTGGTPVLPIRRAGRAGDDGRRCRTLVQSQMLRVRISEPTLCPAAVSWTGARLLLPSVLDLLGQRGYGVFDARFSLKLACSGGIMCRFLIRCLSLDATSRSVTLAMWDVRAIGR